MKGIYPIPKWITDHHKNFMLKQRTKCFKTCSKCGETKLISKFSIDKRNLDGRTGVCKECWNRYYLERYYQNRDKILMQNKKYRDAHQRDRRIYFRNYREEHKERKKNFIIGPFVDYSKNPILSPGKGFTSKGIYNPTVIKEGKNFFMLFRAVAEDNLSGRIGVAKSSDGIHFSLHPEPIIEPSADFDKFGCEDPRVVKFGKTYFLTYVGKNGRYNESNICLATSDDLLHWEKHGTILQPKKGRWNSGQIKAGAILPEKINETYIMYFMGEEKPWKTAIGIAYSKDLFHWYEPQNEPVVVPRKGYFDSQGVEPGPNPILLKEGILFIYNGWGKDKIYKPGGILFSVDEPAKIIKRTDRPLLVPTRNYGKEFNVANHTVAEGLITIGNKWLLYYGAADRLVCLAIGAKEPVIASRMPKFEEKGEMMKYPRQTKQFGYPPEIYHFTGEYSEQIQGYYKADRN